MQTIQAKVQVGSDRTLQVQLPNDVPAGEYELVLVLNPTTPANANDNGTVEIPPAMQKIQALFRESVEPGRSLADELIQERREEAQREEQHDQTDLATRWQQWFEELDQLPMPEEREVPSFQQHLIEKYRQQGLDL